MVDAYLDDLMKDTAEGKRLLEQVRKFYGPSFRVVLIGGPNSLFEFDVVSPSAPAAIIHLGTDSARQTEALAHELYHLSLPLDGYPIIHTVCGDSGYVPGSLGRHANEVQHLIFISRYLSAGFELDKFLTEPARTGYVPAATPNPTHDDTLRFVREDYFGLKIAFALGYSNAPVDLTACRSVGDAHYPGFSAIAGRLDAWFSKVGFADSSNYVDAIVELARILELPLKAVRFCTLEARKDHVPAIIVEDFRPI